VRAYHHTTHHAAVDTNNGVEAPNKALKCKFLPRKSESVSNIATIVVDQFLPEQQINYLFLNMQMDPTYSAYSTEVPAYLIGHPKKIILYCLKKEEKARSTLSEKDILEADQQNGNFCDQRKIWLHPYSKFWEKNQECQAVHAKIG